MRRFLRKTYIFIVSLFKKSPAVTVSDELPACLDQSLVGGDEAQRKVTGEFTFKKDLLDQLGDYFVYLRRMKKADPHAYARYSVLGAQIFDHSMNIYLDDARNLSPWWHAGNRPAFGAVMVNHGDNGDDRITSKFMHFAKFDKPSPHVLPSNGVTYSVTTYWDDKKHLHDRNYGGCGVYHVSVNDACEVTLLREKIHSRERVWSKRRKEYFWIPRSVWGYPEWLMESARERNMEPEQWARLAFGFAMAFHEANYYSMIRVEASKRDVSAVFAIDVKRTPYFFADRENTGENGKRRKIFHIVRAHKRVGRGGKETFIKFHFRGERDFEWNGYDVKVRVPGLHHTRLIEFDDGFHDLAPQDPMPKGMMDDVAAAKLIHGHLAA